MNPDILITAIAPVMLILGLGFAAGKHREFDADQTAGFSRLALQYALPATLFLGMAHLDRRLLLQQAPIALVMLAGYSGFFLVAYAALRWKRMDRLRATLLSYTVSSTAVPIYGVTVLTPIFGQSDGIGIVGLAALVTNLTQVSVAIFLLQSAMPAADAHPSVSQTVWRSVRNPLVWAPASGALLSLTGFRLSALITAALHPLAVAAAGVAIFASGLALAAYPMKLTSKVVVLASAACVVLQPAAFFVLLKAGGLSSGMGKAAFVASAMPTATPSVLFAQQYRILEAETATIMLITTVLLLVSLPVCVALSIFL